MPLNVDQVPADDQGQASSVYPGQVLFVMCELCHLHKEMLANDWSSSATILFHLQSSNWGVLLSGRQSKSRYALDMDRYVCVVCGALTSGRYGSYGWDQ